MNGTKFLGRNNEAEHSYEDILTRLESCDIFCPLFYFLIDSKHTASVARVSQVCVPQEPGFRAKIRKANEKCMIS